LAHDVPARLTPAEGRRFGVTVGLAFILLAGLLWWRSFASASVIVGSLGGLLLLAGVLIPGRLGPVHGAWMRFALAISKITTPVLMAIVYFVVITPMGLIRRAAGKSPIAARRTNTQWEERKAHSRSDLDRQF
jgi:hypothetical protein